MARCIRYGRVHLLRKQRWGVVGGTLPELAAAAAKAGLCTARLAWRDNRVGGFWAMEHTAAIEERPTTKMLWKELV